MLPPLVDINPFRQAIRANQLIVTSNQRLAAQISQAWGLDVAGQSRVWPAPRVFAIDHWLNHCWDELQDQNHSLVAGLSIVGKQQSRYYWERAIKEQDPDIEGNYSRLADDSLRTVQNWNLSLDQVPADTPSTVQFKLWASAYQQLLDRNQLLTRAQSWQLIAEAFNKGFLGNETLICLYGFQSLPPIQSSILEQACQQVEHIKPQPSQGDCYQMSCADAQQELNYAASWAASQLAEDANQRIGILVPDLNQHLSQTARVVAEALKSGGTEVAVNISAGTALSDTPLVRSALQLLSIQLHERPLQEWLELIYSPHSLFADLAVQPKVDIELALRATKRFDFNLDQFLNALRSARFSADSEVEEQLQPLFELQRDQRRQSSGLRSFCDWALYFQSFLDRLGWPGSRSINSLEYQQLQQWKVLLEQLGELDNLGFELGVANAYKHLHELAQDKVFHPQTGDASLQILGLLEGSGLRFDQLWIVGMHSQNFPASVTINPLLPADFQRLHGMPHSLPAKEVQIAQQLLDGYRANTRNLIISYPAQCGEEQLDPSPLLRDMPPLDPDLLGTAATHPSWLHQDNATQIVVDQGPQYDPLHERISGGASLLKNQSTCPFNAFAIHRLWAQPLEEPEQGISAMDRGSILHDVMFRLWGRWKNAEVLHALSASELRLQLSDTIAERLTAAAPELPLLLGPQYLALEQQRLEKLVGQWLEEEKQRPLFEVVAREQPITIAFGDLNISLRLDRVDQINNKQLVIDYKSGEVKPSSWMGARPRDPQLPLYVLASQPQANGCAFAQIKGGKIKFTGVSDSQLISNEKPQDDWALQIQQWQQALSDLALEFTSGNASMQVFDAAAFGFQEYLLPLNRWYEQADIQAALDSSEPEERL